ncbi:hypothetical protein OF829_00755 [Sphingomonas sp. LB-2]|uniref:hypothetical protein n=1 Tax=Sphingomonas caeni TaxID=2984949 RepID=UPI0022302748|nr:hypothetical protein [Sphingomonas caeni]MCW3845750.1 hypothetical protein [Sphingomonas caeni]
MAEWSTGRRIMVATAIAGTLDILFAICLTLYMGKRSVAAMLTGVASGPFPNAKDWGDAAAGAGLAVHFALMAIMATGFVLAANRMPALKRQPVVWGLLYGVATYVVMNLIVVPWRFPTAWPPSPLGIGTQLFAHLILVGIPIALVARKG